MEKIASFTIDHLSLLPGLYVSRKDEKNGVVITTFDLRFTAPNKEQPVDISALHTIEHLGATFFRNGNYKDDIVYFGPMGCRTGCYLVMFGDLQSKDVYRLVLDACDFIIDFDGDIPGATAKECGNYKEQNLPLAKEFIKRYKRELIENKRL